MFLQKSCLLAACSALLLVGCVSSTPTPTPIAPPAQTVPVQMSSCIDENAIEQWARAYATKEPLNNPPAEINSADAACTRARFQEKLQEIAGPLIGYKVALTHPKVQKTFATNQPVWGALYTQMLLPSRSTVPVKYGAWPVLNASLLVRIKSSDINQADTPEQVLSSIDQIIPFIELNDMLVRTPSKLTAHGITAINAGTRLGITGEPLSVPTDKTKQKRLLRELGAMSVRVQTGKGRLLAQGKGTDVPVHPLQSIVWLNSALREQGQTLQAGQWVSLGTFSPMLRPQRGQTFTAVYPGLTGARSVEVTFK